MTPRECQETQIRRVKALLPEAVQAVSSRMGRSSAVVSRLILEDDIAKLCITEVSPRDVEYLTRLALWRASKKAIKKIENPDVPVEPEKPKKQKPAPRVQSILRESSMPKMPRKILFGHTEKDTVDAESPNYLPKITTPEVFNQHVADALEPHVINLVNYIAKERGLAAPSEAQVQKAVQNVDWTQAAYFAKDKDTSPTKLKQFLTKFFVQPLKKTIMGFPAEEIIFVTQALAMAKAMYMGLHFLIDKGYYSGQVARAFRVLNNWEWKRTVAKWR